MAWSTGVPSWSLCAERLRRVLGMCMVSVLVLGLFGCATQTTTMTETTSLNELVRHGRFALRTESPNQDSEAVQGGFVWRDIGSRLTVDLINPFGNILARVTVEPGQATLSQSSGETLRAADPDGLVQQALGERVPVRDLREWLRIPLRALPAMQQIKRDELGRIIAFEQNGWVVALSRFDAQGPRLLVLSRNEGSKQIVIRLVVDVP
jgi:outer membrane lipoprotein LolB